MEAQNIMYGVLTAVLIIMSLNFFIVDLSVSNNLVSNTGLDMDKFNMTQALISDLKEMKNETGILENIPLIGDVVAIVGNAIRALQVMFNIPGIITNMVSEAFKIGGMPSWLTLMISAFVWVAVIWVLIHAAIGRNK